MPAHLEADVNEFGAGRMPGAVCQVPDEPELFERLLALEQQAGDLYRPTNYWSSNASVFVPELRRRGLHDFRRRRGSVLASFIANDLEFGSTVDWSLPVLRWLGAAAQTRGLWRIARPIQRAVNRLASRVVKPEYSFEWAMIYFHALVAKKFEKLGIDFQMLATDRIGNPAGIMEINGARWTWQQLNCASLLGDALSRIDVGVVNTIVELGGGLGRNIQMLARIRPQATILSFDVMPQAYVANQYLKTAMPDRVVPIEQSIELDLANGDLSAVEGKIVIMPAWKMPECRKIRADLFCNSASFQEMEPAVARNYLALVKEMRPRWISIDALPGGNYWGEWAPGKGGTKQPVASSIYSEALAPDYQCIVDAPADYLLRSFDYRAWIFARHSDAP
jgi:putative sugar O-methyltransferase